MLREAEMNIIIHKMAPLGGEEACNMSLITIVSNRKCNDLLSAIK
jgi:hypothetical protein